MTKYTELLYLEIPAVSSVRTPLIKLYEHSGLYFICPAKSPIHLKGGGQEDDVGYVDGEPILSNEILNGLVHIGITKEKYTTLNEKSQVLLTVNQETRELNSRLHSGGHVLADILENNLGNGIKVTVCNHYPGQANIGVDTLPIEVSPEQIQELYDTYLKENMHLKPKVETINYNLLTEQGKPTRSVKLGLYSCKCGGTHVDDLKKLEGLKILKIKRRQGDIRIRYYF